MNDGRRVLYLAMLGLVPWATTSDWNVEVLSLECSRNGVGPWQL